MCGIGGIYLRSDTARVNLDAFTDAMLLALQHRGRDATGLLALSADWTPTLDKLAMPASKFIVGRASLPRDTRAILLHTRLATQGKTKFAENNHPVSHDDVWVTHNGHIWNDSDVFEGLGVTRGAAVDSVAIPAVLSAHDWHKQIADALAELDGDMACAAVSLRHPDEVILARGLSSPLYVHETANAVVWASTPDAIMRAWAAGIGTPPDRANLVRYAYVREGTILRLSDGRVDRSRFTPREDAWRRYYVPATSSTGTTWTDSGTSGRTLGVWQACNSCNEYVPQNELTRIADSYVCEECAMFFREKSDDDVCEYCGHRAQIGDAEGYYVGLQWICQTCCDWMLDDEVREGLGLAAYDADLVH